MDVSTVLAIAGAVISGGLGIIVALLRLQIARKDSETARLRGETAALEAELAGEKKERDNAEKRVADLSSGLGRLLTQVHCTCKEWAPCRELLRASATRDLAATRTHVRALGDSLNRDRGRFVTLHARRFPLCLRSLIDHLESHFGHRCQAVDLEMIKHAIGCFQLVCCHDIEDTCLRELMEACDSWCRNTEWHVDLRVRMVTHLLAPLASNGTVVRSAEHKRVVQQTACSLLSIPKITGSAEDIAVARSVLRCVDWFRSHGDPVVIDLLSSAFGLVEWRQEEYQGDWVWQAFNLQVWKFAADMRESLVTRTSNCLRNMRGAQGVPRGSPTERHYVQMAKCLAMVTPSEKGSEDHRAERRALRSVLEEGQVSATLMDQRRQSVAAGSLLEINADGARVVVKRPPIVGPALPASGPAAEPPQWHLEWETQGSTFSVPCSLHTRTTQTDVIVTFSRSLEQRAAIEAYSKRFPLVR